MDVRISGAVWNVDMAGTAGLPEGRAAVMSNFIESLRAPHTPFISPKRFSQILGAQVVSLPGLPGQI